MVDDLYQKIVCALDNTKRTYELCVCAYYLDTVLR